MAVWMPEVIKDKTYFVIHGNGALINGSSTWTIQLTKRTEIVLPNVVREGYEFLGFTNDKEGNDPYTITTTPDFNGRKDIYAQWRAKNYDIVYHSNNGKYEVATASAFHGDKVIVRDNVNSWTREGYTFKNWSIESEIDSTTYEPDKEYDELTKTDKIDLYARWEKNAATIHYNANGGTGSMQDEAYTYGDGGVLSANAFERASYVFSGWSTSSSDTVLRYVDGSKADKIILDNAGIKDIVLYAVWIPEGDAVDVIYNLKDGYIGNTSKARLIKVQAGSSFIKLEVHKEGYDQLDYVDAYGNTLTDASIISAKTYVEANWQYKTHRVFYDGKGGTKSGSTWTREGYNLIGFDTEPDANIARYSVSEDGSSIITDDDDIVLYAVWEGETYHIRYNGNGGKEVMPDTIFNYGDTVRLSVNRFTKTGYNACGYKYTNADNETMYFASGEAIDTSIFDTTASGYIDLQSVYLTKITTIVLDGNGGHYSDGNGTYDLFVVEGEVLNFEIPTRAGFEFVGYGDITSVETKVEQGIGTGSEWKYDIESASVQAQWRGLSNTIKYIDIATGDNNFDKNASYENYKVADKIQSINSSKTYGNRVFKGWRYGDVVYEEGDTIPTIESKDGSVPTLYSYYELPPSETYDLVLEYDKMDMVGGVVFNSGTEQYTYHNLTKDSTLNIYPWNIIDLKTQLVVATFGYQRWGWFNDEGKMEYPPSFTLTRDDRRVGTVRMTFKYIKAANIIYSVTYNANGGYVAGQTDSITIPMTELSGVVEPECYITGGEFIGWVDTSGNPADFEKIASEKKDVTLYALWRNTESVKLYIATPTNVDSHGYKVALDTNFAIRFMKLSDPTIDKGITIPGYEFAYWAEAPDGYGYRYYLTDRYEDVLDKGYGETNLYSIWKPIGEEVESTEDDTEDDTGDNTGDNMTAGLTMITSNNSTRVAENDIESTYYESEDIATYLDADDDILTGSWEYNAELNTWSYRTQNSTEPLKSGWYHIISPTGASAWYKFDENGFMKVGLQQESTGFYYLDDDPLSTTYGSLIDYVIETNA